MDSCKNYIVSTLAFGCVFFYGIFLQPTYASDCTNVMDIAKKQSSLLAKQKLLSQAVKDCPDDPLIHLEYAYNCERRRKYDEALKHYTIASKLGHGKLSDAYWGMGDIHMILGDTESAIQAYERGLRLDPNSTIYQRNLELARIKYKSQIGSKITSDEFVKVMEEEKPRTSDERSVEGPYLRMPIKFQFGSAVLTPKAKKQLDIVGKAMQHESLKNVTFEVAGHTDDIGDSEANLLMSKNRAEAVRDYIINTFMIVPERLVITYFGEDQPAVPNTNKSNRAINRRVEFKRKN